MLIFFVQVFFEDSMSRSWKMCDTVYVHWFVQLTSQSESSSPTLIRNAQSADWVLIRTDPKLQATIRSGCYCVILGSQPNFYFHHIQFWIYFFCERRRKDDWLEKCYSIWLGLMFRFPLLTLVLCFPSAFADFAAHDQEWLLVKTEPTHLPDQKLP